MNRQFKDDKVGEMKMLEMFCPENCKGTGLFGNLIVDLRIILKCEGADRIGPNCELVIVNTVTGL
jgi:hypothetical protein